MKWFPFLLLQVLTRSSLPLFPSSLPSLPFLPSSLLPSSPPFLSSLPLLPSSPPFLSLAFLSSLLLLPSSPPVLFPSSLSFLSSFPSFPPFLSSLLLFPSSFPQTAHQSSFMRGCNFCSCSHGRLICTNYTCDAATGGGSCESQDPLVPCMTDYSVE